MATINKHAFSGIFKQQIITMKRSVSILLLFLLNNNAVLHAQNVQFDVNLEGFSSFGSVRINNLDALGTTPVSNFNYSDVSGSAFWSDKWTTARLYTSTYNILLGEVKLNFYTNETWYRDETGKTMTVNQGVIKKIIFYKFKDTTTIITTFVYLQNVGDSTNHYFEILNEGRTQLFKLDNITLYKGNYDVVNGKQEYTFLDKPDYYLLHNNTVTKLRSLNKDVVLPIIQPSADDEAWLKKSGNKLRNQKDFAAFLNYFNQQRQNASKTQ